MADENLPETSRVTASTQRDVAAPAPAKPKRVRKWLGRLVALSGLLMVTAAWFAPAIIAQTDLKQQAPKLLLPRFPGEIDVGFVSLDWLKPVVVRDLKAEDAQGNPLLQIKELSTSEPLWKLALNPSKLGRLILSEPQLSVEIRSTGSNIEDVLEKLFSGPAGKPPEFELEIHDATVTLEHKVASVSSTIKPVSLILVCHRGKIDDLELTIGDVPASAANTQEQGADWLAIRYGNEPTQDGVAMSPGSKHIRVKAEGWTIDKFLPVLARFAPSAEMQGTLDADMRSQIDFADNSIDWNQRDFSWDGRVTVKKFLLAGLPILKRDRVVLGNTSLGGRVATQQGRLSMENLQLQTEVGSLIATGDIPLAGLETSPWNAIRSALGDQDYAIQGHVDLQKVAVLLPNTLRIRNGTEITSGSVDVSIQGSEQAGKRHWSAEATINKLAAQNLGKPITWNEPLKFSIQAHKDQELITIDQAVCQSDFFKLSGRGSLMDAKFNASGDLARLESNLQQFIELGIEKLAGRLNVEGEIRRAEDDQVTLTALVQLDNFQLDVSQDKVWREPRLTLGVHASGKTSAGSELKQISTGDLKLTSGPDLLTASLLQPLEFDRQSVSTSIKVILGGDLRTWQNRIRPFYSLNGWQLGGLARIETTLTADEAKVEFANLTGEMSNLDIRGPQWWIKEPQVKLNTGGTWSIGQRAWTSPEVTFSSTALSARISDLLIGLKPDNSIERVTGDATYRGDLDKLSKWKNQALQRPTYALLGIFEGNAHLSERDSVISGDFEMTVSKFILADLETFANQELHWVALWREPQLQLSAKGRFDIPSDQMQFDSMAVQADGLSLSAAGSASQLSADQYIDLKGQLSYDWQIVSQRMDNSLKKSIQLTGKQTRPIAIKGSLASLGNQSIAGTNLTGTAGFGWDAAIIEGMKVGPVDVTAQIDRGICQFAPIDTTVANSRIHLTPQIRLDQKPAMIVLPAERVVDQVQLTPELCNKWMKYAAPLMADSAQMDGQFTLDLAGGTLPLTAPTTGELSGTLGVHHVRVRPGGAALQIAGVIDQIKSIIQRKPVGNAPRDQIWMQMPEQAIPFKLTGGRVYHQNVIFGIGEATVQSSGSVGLDESIDLTLQIPLQDDWIKDQKLLAGMKGKSVRIPLRGALSRPQIDSRVLTELASQIGGTALEGVIENKLDDVFKKKLGKFLPGQD